MAAAIVAAGAISATDAAAQGQPLPGEGHRASAAEAALLPKFCWGQYMDVKGPEYGISGCGPAVNHYCWGLVELLRANRTFGNQWLRVGYLQKAKANMQYTFKGMEPYPTCWLKPHVEQTYAQIQSGLRIYNAK